MNHPKRSSSLLRTPVFADPIVQWQADLVYPVCWATLLSVLVSTAASVLYFGTPTIASNSTILLAIPILVAIQLTRRGRIRAGAWVLSLSMYALITVAAIFFAKVTDVVHLYAIATVIAGLVLGGEALGLLTALGIALVSSLVVAEAHGWLPPPSQGEGISSTIISLVTGVLMAAWIASRAIASSRRAREAWASTNAELQTVLATLEDTVEQRTADLRLVNARLHDEVGVRNLIQADLVDARDEAEAAVQAKTRFVANVSHEIRTPLNGIIGLADLLVLEDLPLEVKEHVETIRTSGELMKGLVEDVLDFSRLEADGVELEEIDFNLGKVINAAIAPLQVTARRRGLSLEVTVDRAMPRRVRGDPGRLSQVLTNLVGNAIKFTTEGTVTIEANAIDQQSEGVQVHFRVQDTGVGMSTEKARRIFDPFVQGDSSTTRRYGGTGLGLTIAKQLVENLGGTISVSSRPGQGSTFEFTIPLHTSMSHHSIEQESPWRPRTDGPSLHVLIVEDNDINQMVAVAMLDRLGHRHGLAADGHSALDRLATTPYDVVLMDCQMPGIDGLETCRRLRAVPGPNREVPVVALTAHDSAEQRDAVTAAGMNAFMSKPVDFEALANVLAAIGPRAITSPPSTPSTPLAPAKLDESALGELRTLEAVRPGLLAKMAQLYLEQTPDRIKAVKDASTPEARANAAHTIKGSSMSLGASGVGRAAAAIETAARAGSASDELLPSLREAFDAIRPAIQALAHG